MTVKPAPFAFEFRFFGPSLERERERLSAAGVAQKTEDMTEIYLISRLTIDASVKVRDHVLEIKELAERAGVLEGWVRAQSANLPVLGSFLSAEALSRLGVSADVDRNKLYDLGDIVALAEAVPGLSPYPVGKRRTIFDIEDVRGEFASVTAEDHVIDTIAFEATETEPLLRLINDLGFAERLNESYPCYLQRLAFYSEGAGSR